MNLVLPVVLLLCAIPLFLRIAVLTWDTLVNISEYSWHPAKLAVRVGALILGLLSLFALFCLIKWLCHIILTL